MLLELFCKHRWYSHAKSSTKYKTARAVEGTGNLWKGPRFLPVTEELTKEIIICEKCGKIKTLIY